MAVDQQTAAAAAAPAGSGVTPGVQSVLDKVFELYQCRATEASFDSFSPTAVFADPLMYCIGLPQIKSAFLAMPKAFKTSETLQSIVTSNITEAGNGTISIDLLQRYVVKGLNKEKKMASTVWLELEQWKIIRMEDRWDHKELEYTKSTLGYGFRRFGGLVNHGLMKVLRAS
eukprot:jgi/Chlat1/7796/Chrsp66S07257